MKRRLRSNVENALIIISAAELLFIATLNDFEMSAIPFIVLVITSFVFNVRILRKYGKGNYGA